ncbi:hypothetical protein ICN84_07765 [Akkermansia glycaniphila]|uniref:hypothetical protein n=1 Tax=Akkermansia glycaniphila TaxID=1679444 RepID=UPI001C02C682|nr:hypothetical protein [Akkermansia glycaniphila]MBT9449969.1 hypothetical protein [Akkermansia glycaniphila]
MNEASFIGQKPGLKEEESPGVSQGVACESVFACPDGDSSALHALAYDETDKLAIPLEFARCLFLVPLLMIQSKDEQVFLRVSQLFVFLSHLEFRLGNLSLKKTVSPRELAILADEVHELKGMAREAMARLNAPSRSVPESSGSRSNASPEAVEEGESGSNADAADNVL